MLVAPVLLRRALVNFFGDNGLDLSAAVAFYSLVSLGPAFYLVASILSRVFADTSAGQAAIENLMPFFPIEVAAERVLQIECSRV